MDLNALNEVINKFGTLMIDQMKYELETNGKIATGELLDSISFTSQVEAERILVQFLSNDYGKFVEEGRRAGSYVPVSKIQQWCNIKGIPEKAVFPIIQNIYKFGIKPQPFIMQPINNLKQDFIIALMVVYGQQVQIDVKQAFNDFPKQVIVSEGN